MSFLEKYWYEKNQSCSLVLWALKFLSVFYCLAIIIRKKVYQWGIFNVYSLDIPVIIVGNLTVGGTGKTPLVITLAALLKTAGYYPGIVSRGYGGHAQHYPLSVTPETNPHESGDEAVLIAQRTQCPVVVAPKRVEAVRYLQKKSQCDVIISDDGLQHLAMARDIEIVVVDGQRGFGNGYCLPAGPLREPIFRMKNVDFIFVNGKDFHIKPECFIEIFNEEKTLKPNHFSGQTVHAVMGIGNPQRFLQTLTDLNILYEAHIFPDHHEFTAKDFIFADSAPIIMTEKDAVKCRKMTINNNNLYYLKVSAIIDDEKNSFKDDFLKRINIKQREKS